METKQRASIIIGLFLLVQCSMAYSIHEVKADQYPGNSCLSFDGTNYVDFNQSQVFDAAELTIEAWIKPLHNVQVGSDSLYGHRWGTLVHRDSYSSQANHGGWWLGIDYSSGKVEFRFTYPNGSSYISYNFSQTPLYSSQWYYIAVTYDTALQTGNLKFYADGVLDSQYDEQHAILYEDNPLQVGMQANSPDIDTRFPYSGLIDEFRIWNVSRTQTDVQDSWKRTLRNDEILNSNLVGYWRFDNDYPPLPPGGDILDVDYSSYNNAATLLPSSNPPQWTSNGAPIIPELPLIPMMLFLITMTSLAAILLRRHMIRQIRME